jgi:thiamine-monophosphate kinase
MSDRVALGPGREFDAIRDLATLWGERAAGLGDDAAVIDMVAGEKLVASTDTSVENIHFRADWLTPEEIGWRATMAALSDLAAMGARPLGLLCAIAVPGTWRAKLVEIGKGIGDAAVADACPIRGGDLSVGTELALAITVLGAATNPLMRSGARAGDALWITGRLGGPHAAMHAWLAGESPDDISRERFARPVARIKAGQWLARHGAHAAIDISDGLVSDARHIAAASNVSCFIDLDDLPLLAGIAPEDGARSGEEYELLVAAPADLDVREFRKACGVLITRVGTVKAGAADVFMMSRGARVDIQGGHDHFSR